MRPAISPDAVQRLDVLESLFSDAVWLVSQHAAALLSPDYALGEVAEGLEPRLRVHLDALVVAPPEPVASLCVPSLASDQPGAPLCAATILLEQAPVVARESISALLEEGPIPWSPRS